MTLVFILILLTKVKSVNTDFRSINIHQTLCKSFNTNPINNRGFSNSTTVLFHSSSVCLKVMSNTNYELWLTQNKRDFNQI